MRPKEGVENSSAFILRRGHGAKGRPGTGNLNRGCKDPESWSSMNPLSILFFLIIAFALLVFGYTLFFRLPRRRGGEGAPKQEVRITAKAGDPQTCPVCLAKLPRGMLVRSAVFPSYNGRDRLMHLMGCPYCLEGEPEQRRPRVCPVCHKPIGDTEYLFARVFERPGKSHVHVLGCINCRGPRAMR